MLWLLYSLITAFSLATADALSKKAMRETHEYMVVWVREGYAIPFLAIVFFFIDIPSLDKTFWITVLTLLPLEILALIFYVKAIRLSPLSISIPLMATTPVFIILTAFILLGELPDKTGVLGIFLITAGAYLLNVKASREGILEPFKAIGREKGAIFMLIVAFLYSITASLGKIAILHSSPVFFGFFYPFLLTLILSPIVWFRLKGEVRQVTNCPFIFFSIGFFSALMIIFHFLAINLVEVAYMISVKRTSLIFSVLYGKFLFDEKNITERLLGSTVMILGVVLITFV